MVIGTGPVLAIQLAAGDCEALASGWLEQPVNAASSAAYLVAATWVWRNTSRRGRVFAVLLIAVGVGSFAFHGPGGSLSRYVHDVAIAATLVVVGATHVAARSTGAVVWLVAGLATLLAVVPDAGTAVITILGVGAVVTASAPAATNRAVDRRHAIMWGAVVLGVAAQAAGRTGGPWCDPGGLLQLHAVWHAATALAGAAWASIHLGNAARHG